MKSSDDYKKSYRIELKREKKGMTMQEEVVQLATSGLELTLSGLGPQQTDSVKLRARVHTLGHHSKRYLDGPNLTKDEKR